MRDACGCLPFRACMTQLERLILALRTEGHSVRVVARKLGMAPRKVTSIYSGALGRVEEDARRAARVLIDCIENRGEDGRLIGRDGEDRHAPVEDENCRPVTIRAKMLTEDDFESVRCWAAAATESGMQR